MAKHQVRYGFDYEHLDYSQLVQYTGPTFTAPNGQQTATGAAIDIIPDPAFGQIYHVSRASLTDERPTTQHYAALFVEDVWRIGNSLTIRPGVRYEQEKMSGTIVQDFSLKNNWAPRVGVVWDPTSSGKAKVFANYGRYYARVPNDLASRALSSDASLTADYFDANLTQPVPDGVVTTNAATGAQTSTHFTLLGGGADDIDPNAKLSYYNEWVVGTDTPLIGGIDLGVRYVHRDIGRVLEDVQPYPISQRHWDCPGPRRPITCSRIPVRTRPWSRTFQAPRSASKRRCTTTTPSSSPPTSGCRTMVADLVVPMVAADREFRGLLPQRQRPVGSGHFVALRLPDQRPDVRDDRKGAIRLQRRHPVPRRRRKWTAAARSNARHQGIRHLLVQHGAERIRGH